MRIQPVYRHSRTSFSQEVMAREMRPLIYNRKRENQFPNVFIAATCNNGWIYNNGPFCFKVEKCLRPYTLRELCAAVLSARWLLSYTLERWTRSRSNTSTVYPTSSLRSPDTQPNWMEKRKPFTVVPLDLSAQHSKSRGRRAHGKSERKRRVKAVLMNKTLNCHWLFTCLVILNDGSYLAFKSTIRFQCIQLGTENKHNFLRQIWNHLQPVEAFLFWLKDVYQLYIFRCVQSNPLNRSPDNGSICLLVQYLTGPIL